MDWVPESAVPKPTGPGQAGRAILRDVEILFTSLLVLAGLVITWFAVYVVYRLYSDQR